MQDFPKIVMIALLGKILEQAFHVVGKLTYSHIKGGVLLKETDFTIKEEKTKQNIENFKK